MNHSFRDIYADNKDQIFRFLHTFIRNEAVSEELTQDVFLKIFKKMDTECICIPDVRNYLFSVARSTALDYIRKERAREKHFRKAVIEAGLDDIFSSSLEDYYIEGEIMSNLREAINSFPENERKIFIETQIERRGKKRVIKEHNVTLYRINKIREKVSQRIKRKLDSYYDD